MRPSGTLSSESLQAAVFDVLRHHRGRGHAIKLTGIIAELTIRGVLVGISTANAERRVRDAIHELRNQGDLICSVASSDGGYFIAADKAEVVEFVESEIQPRISDLAHTKTAILEAARRQFGDAAQMGLF